MNWKKWIWPAVLLVVAVVTIVMISGRKNSGEVDLPKPSETKQTEIPQPVYRYGIPIDSFNMEDYTVKKNQNLSEILLARGISYARIDELARESKAVFDVRKIKAGRPCTFFYTTDTLERLAFMVYERDRENFLVYDFRDSIRISEGQKEIEIEERSVKGKIESSLWNAMVDLNVSTKLAIELSTIFAWTIDFFGIQKGDQFNIVYTVKKIDGEAIGVDEILAASIYHGGKMHYGYRFEQNGQVAYFDDQGQSLKRAFLKAPFEYIPRISSGYSNSRLHPILRIYRPHRGIDYAAPQGTEVLSIGDGKVVKVSYDKASGNYIKIKHNSVYTSGYMHLMKRPKNNVGDYIKQGQVIGYVGKTGYATGPHLDFRIWKNGQLVNPLEVESPPVEPVADDYQARFDSVKAFFTPRLQFEELNITE